MNIDEAGLDRIIGAGIPQRVGVFRFYLDGQRWEWSDAVAGKHGSRPGAAHPSPKLLLSHKHPDDRPAVPALLDKVRDGAPFSSRHRIIDTAGHTHLVVVVADRMLSAAGELLGTAGFYVDITDGVQADLQVAIDEAIAEITESRAAIEQAKGALMLTYNISADRAFDVLAWRSQQTNLKVRDLAQRILHDMTEVDIAADARSAMDLVLLRNPEPP
ncbi:ANTAR domain-containing protein [Antrihabitans cavernicola]|uniref:ANTAR domain-containing protein n=1 Tax=Antrihabitans cavernicola TaxID=2495913 RepID=UPI0035304E21